jgi:hypothetical protein
MTYQRLTENPGPCEGACESDHAECLAVPGFRSRIRQIPTRRQERFLAKPDRRWYSTPCSTETPGTDPKQYIFNSKHVQEAL